MVLWSASRGLRFLLLLAVGIAAAAIIWQMLVIVRENNDAARLRRIMDVNIELLDASCRFAASLADERALNCVRREGAQDALEASRAAVDESQRALLAALAAAAIPSSPKDRIREALKTYCNVRTATSDSREEVCLSDSPESRIIHSVIDAVHEVPNAPTTSGLGKIMASVFELARAYEAAALMRDSYASGRVPEENDFGENDVSSIGYHSLFFLIHFPPANLGGASKEILRSIGDSPEWARVRRWFRGVSDLPDGVERPGDGQSLAVPLGGILEAIQRAEAIEVKGLRGRIKDLHVKGRAEMRLHMTAFAALLAALSTLAGLTIATIRGSSRLAASNRELQAKNEQVLASVNYAKVIQLSMLPRNEAIWARLADWFVLYKPRDIVGGDYYWFKDLGEDGFLVAVVDCTGHGVPGAFMTMTSNSVLNGVAQQVASSHSPAELLRRVNRIMMETLHQTDDSTLSNDGLDIGLCWVLDREKRMLFSGAKLSLYYTQDGQVREVSGDRRSIGYKRSNLETPFAEHEIELVEGRTFYLCSDGFWDQSGGEKGFGFGRKKFMGMLAEGSLLPLGEQRASYVRTLEGYMGRLRQTDDITLMGFMVF
ncbi:MAG: SpoIIE family protein phosphatase [Syntrophobacteraceae bacterium]